MPKSRVLLTGATGFVGRSVLPALREAGFEVICTSRDPARARSDLATDVEVRQMDLGDRESVRRAAAGCDSAVYLVHSMASTRDYHEVERASALTFREEAARAGLSRIVYLGGMVPVTKPSRHLASRLATGAVLRAGRVPTIELQAAMIIGAGSEGFRIVRDLSARLPVMALPRWLESRSQPIAVADVCQAIVLSLSTVPAREAILPIPGPETLSARAILERTAVLLGHRPWMFGVPVVTPRLSSYWIRFVTRADHLIADELVEGLRSDILAPDEGFWKLVPGYARVPFDAAVSQALRAEAQTLSAFDRALERVLPHPRAPRGHEQGT